MRVTVIGAGYVGLVTAACFADVGNQVTCIERDPGRLSALRDRAEVPFYEPGLGELVRRNIEQGRLALSPSIAEGLPGAQVCFIAVGTPSLPDGRADLSQVEGAATEIGRAMTGPLVVVQKSTAPVGTIGKVRALIETALAERGLNHRLGVVSNPEFLKEGSAIEDFTRGDRIVLGSDDAQAIATMRELYRPFNRNHEKIMVMDAASAELTKYAANAMLATRISFMNELARIAEAVGADIEQIRKGIGVDHRIGSHFLYAGAGYGGSCFPKDVKALAHTARGLGLHAELVEAVDAVNQRQKLRLFEKISDHYQGELAGKTFALWGLAFKPNTDDMRDAPSLDLISALLQAGSRVRAWDPVAVSMARSLLPEHPALEFAADARATLNGADALAVVTEWHAFRSPDFATLASALRDRVVFDGRNIWDPEFVRACGLRYYGIGRG
ncbi:MAG: UDP-glucose/GDP-mannose dehydrogenase family protein [Thiomonas sp.]|uniref:UDP-glucose dehydrogenase family protein n=1 Tax=Thiomonas sp. TaxID=2047785 RepID=UPI002A36861E|nr:UDP-glucose/GDP-mannose dehydrogenase family protein [Thiomonas sp.]MDY0331478.1 UDP-glucose/GDP-mannose dehydrogenase family protein [Thiomonas sp.]